MTRRRAYHPTDVVRAAGALVWRRQHGRLEVALVHRPRYDDWSWPKGKLDPGEDFPQAAVREVWEETGLRVRLGVPLPGVEHSLASGQIKVTKYWAAQAVGGEGHLVNEIDDVIWLSVDDALAKLTYPRDHAPLRALHAADDLGQLQTWPLVFVRHSHAVARSAYRGPKDWHRPLSDRGKARAKALVPVLSAWLPEIFVSSAATRCVQTVRPYCKAHEVTLKKTKAFTEETFTAKPQAAGKKFDKLLRTTHDRALTSAAEQALLPSVGVCTHRPLIPTMMTQLIRFAPVGSAARRTLGAIRGRGMDKGEVLVCQFAASDDGPCLVSAERVRTPALQR